MKSKVVISADIDDDNVEAFLVVVRAFDATVPGCHFQIAIDGGGLEVDQVKAMFKRLGLPIIFTAERVQ